MVTLPDFIKIGALVAITGWYGVIVDVAVGAEHIMVYIESPKMVYRNQRGEWLDYTLNPDAWQPATRADLRREIADYRARVWARMAELDEMEKRLV